MRLIRLVPALTWILLLAIPLALGQNLVPPANNPKYAPDRILVKFRPTFRANAQLAMHTSLGTRTLRQFNLVKNLELVGLPSGMTIKDALKAYRQNANVEYAEPDYAVHALTTPNDVLFPQMWNLLNTGQSGGTAGVDVGVTSAWNLTTGNHNVIVAVIDTGIDYTHPDLADNMFRNTADCNNNGVDDDGNGFVDDCYGINTTINAQKPWDPLDDNGHGTHVSGTIGAAGNNGVGVTGINWNVQLMACKFLTVGGGGFDSSALDCLDYVLMMKNRGYNIVATNNSWGGGAYSQALVDAIKAQQNAGILFITAAGNEFSDNDQIPTYPANTFLPNVISVAATNRTDGLAGFSNFGRHTVHMGAPGQEILSTLPNSTYGIFSGTSMATPHVTGAAALLAAHDGTLDWRAIKNLILAGGDTVSSLSGTVTGKRLNLNGSLNCANTTVRARLQPVNQSIAASVGDVVTLEVLNINCAQPNGTVHVTVSPGGQNLTLVDDGTNGDQAAGDGIYTAQWIPTVQGNYTLTFPGSDVVTAAVLTNYQVPTPTTFNYRNITGTNLNLGDDSVAQVTSPFSIPFGNGSFTSLQIGANGTISFTDASSPFFSLGIPAGIPTPVTLVAPFWMDLDPVAGSNQNVFWAVTGSAPNRELVVEWRNVRSFDCHGDATATVKFEVVFSESSGNVLFEYSDASFGGQCDLENHGGRAVVGIQVAPSVGTMWTAYQQSIGDNSALLWTVQTSTLPPVNPAPVLNSLSPSTITLGGPDFTLTANGSNFVPGAMLQWNGFDRPTTFVSNTKLTAQISASDIGFVSPPSVNINIQNPPPGGGPSGVLTYKFSNAGPVITSLSPSTAQAGSFSFALTINGSGFSWTQSEVRWNGTLIQGATVVSPTKIIVGIPYTLIANVGTAQVTVVSSPPGGGTSNASTFTISTAPAGGAVFQQQTSFLSGHWTPDDLVPPKPPVRFLGWKYAARGGSDYLKTFLRQRAQAPIESPNPVLSNPLGGGLVAEGGGTPQPASLAGLQLRTLLPADFIPTAVATGDFDGDGIPDWVVSNGGSNNLWVYLGSGNGGFKLASVIPVAGQSPVAAAVADLRGIGKQDLIVAEADSGSIGILLGNGDGTFGVESDYYLPGPPLAMAVADVNHDGHLDVVAGIVPDFESGPVVTLPGDGTGHFGRVMFEPNFFDVEVPTSLIVADFEKNGKPDVILVDPSTAAWVYGNDGTGLFKRGQPVFGGFPGGGLSALTATPGDVNEDGCPDVVVFDSFDLARVFIGDCGGGFTEQSSFVGMGDVGWGGSLVDMNGDGHLDLVYSGIAVTAEGDGQDAGNLIGVLYGDGKGNFGNASVYRGGQSSFGLAIADFNRDGHPDIITANQDSDSVTLLLNSGDGTFGAPRGEYIGYIHNNDSNGAVNSPRDGITVADVNGDGKPDLINVELGPGTPQPFQATVMLNDGTGKFGLPIQSPIAEGTLVVGDYVLGDFRNTGKLDLVTIGGLLSFTSSYLSFAAGNGNGSFATPKLSTPNDAVGIMAVGDFDRDGKLDFVTVRGNPNSSAQVVLFQGHGDGTFTPQAPNIFNTNGPGVGPQGVWAGDFNHDGKLDLLVWMFQNQVPGQNHDVFELLGNGNGTFAPARQVATNLLNVVVADVNNDGRPDLVEIRDPMYESISQGPATYKIYLCQADGSFVLTNTYAPYTGWAYGPSRNFGTANGGRFNPIIGDYNGDGNIDIAVFQRVPGLFPQDVYVQFMLGNGDGSFTPTYQKFDLNRSVATAGFDLNGDARTDMVELDGYTSSFHVIPSQFGPTLQMQMLSQPVIGTQGHVHITLAVPAAAGTVVSLTTSDPAITIPASASIPQGNLTQDVAFQIGSSFNSKHVFSIMGTLSGSTAVAYGTQVTSGGQYGVAIVPNNSIESTRSGGTTPDFQLFINSIAGYATSLTLQCQGLPAGATCQFGANPVSILSGQDTSTSLTIKTTSATPSGVFPFTIVGTDGNITSRASATLSIGDYNISIDPGSTSALTGTNASFTLNVSLVNNYQANLRATCTGLPTPAVCNLQAFVGLSTPITIQTSGLAAGNYPFTVTVTDGIVNKTATAEVKVGDFTVTPSTTAVTISVGQSGNIPLTVKGVNGFADNVSLGCVNAPTGVGCSVSPSPVAASANGTTTTMTINVVSRPQVHVANSVVHRTAKLYVLLGVVGLVCCVFIVAKNSTTSRMALLTVLVAFTVTSCGGGAGGGGAGGGGGGGGGGGNGTTASVTIQASSDGVTRNVGTIKVTVP